MAKSTRSKVKRTYRAKKREDGVYAAIEAARLARLSAKLKAVASLPTEEDVEEGGEEGRADAEGDEVMEDADAEGVDGEKTEGKETMDVDGAASSSKSTRVSTHGPRQSRRESWRSSKGLAPRPKARGMNRQGTVAAKRKSGRSHRRR
ncbi:uncharacterized protein STEHIDRAFT_95279 [Stereum hirsutum FP-91666 SS1]|uniref:uncharacterized protein n=1 Tax=Stereum hirsutum (strain FP-91666) TaxID=721885 RepID=UPI000440FF71|nr:uncharacterized protein STEHIDRAFT_95279 [Stereum hirsutum FP-91666 SS1]EIM88246.1 hypothetical protein STEHIDRAFT_95279 [Stereum hirsutum FP-91666 SS1]